MKEENESNIQHEEEKANKTSSFHNTQNIHPNAIGPIGPYHPQEVDAQLEERLNRNRNMIHLHQSDLHGLQATGVENSNQSIIEQNDIQDSEEQSETIEGDGTGSVSEETESSSLASLLGMFGFSDAILKNPTARKYILIGSAGILLTLLVLVVMIMTVTNGRVQSSREAVNSYLETGEIEDEGETDQSILDSIQNSFTDSDLYKYLQAEGWCKNGKDCYNSDAARFYKTFRRKIKNAELVYNAASLTSSIATNCGNAGFPSTVKLDVPMLTATFTLNRNDDEYLSHREDENYNDKLAGFSKEMDGLISAMVIKEDNVVYEVEVTNPQTGKKTEHSTTSESKCNRYGLTWKENARNAYGGYCVKEDGDELPEYTKISGRANSCYILSEENYKDYIVGNGQYYQTPGTYTQGGFSNSGSSSNISTSNTFSKNTTVKEYIEAIGSWASKDMSNSGIYASITIAQGIIEGAHGTSGLTIKFNNHFGIKAGIKGVPNSCSSSQAGTTRKDTVNNPIWDGTSACMCGRDGCFWYRAYKNTGESLADHTDFFWRNSRYGKAGVLDCVQNNLGPEEQIRRIKKAGYATDPDYVSKIMGTINSYNLQRYDTGTFNGTNPNYGSPGSSSGSSNGNDTTSNNNNAPNYYTSGGYLELYRMDLLEDYIDIQVEKEAIYDDILKEAQETGSTFGQDNVTNNQYGGITDSANGDWSSWKQYAPDWGQITIGNTTKTIKSVGCAATSVAIQIARSGTKVNIDNFNPGTFVLAMNRVGGFDGALIKWDTVSKIAPFFQYAGATSLMGYSKQQKLNKISELLKEGCYIILNVKGGGHWVAVTSVTNDDILIIDPGYSGRTLAWSSYSVAGTKQLRCYKKLD